MGVGSRSQMLSLRIQAVQPEPGTSHVESCRPASSTHSKEEARVPLSPRLPHTSHSSPELSCLRTELSSGTGSVLELLTNPSAASVSQALTSPPGSHQ